MREYPILIVSKMCSFGIKRTVGCLIVQYVCIMTLFVSKTIRSIPRIKNSNRNFWDKQTMYQFINLNKLMIVLM